MRLLSVFALLLLFGGVARATDTVLTTVDDMTIDWNASSVSVTGIVSGEATARTIVLTIEGDSTVSPGTYSAMIDFCQRSALLSLNRPGRYLLTLRSPDLQSTLTACKLTRQ